MRSRTILVALRARRLAHARGVRRRAEGDADARLDAEPRPRRLLRRAEHRPLRESRPRRHDPERPPIRPHRSSSSRPARATSPSPTSRSSSSQRRASCPSIAVAAVVPQPLNSIIAIEPRIRSVRDLKGRTVGITGVPSDYAALDTALASAGLTRKDVHVVSVGYNLLPALLAHRVDAVLGVYRNVEGIQLQERGLKPTIIPLDRAGIPSYDELVLVANAQRLRTDAAYRSTVRRFVGAFLAGTADARQHPQRALAILRRSPPPGQRFLARATPATLALLAGRDGIGCMRTAQWQRFGNWMHTRSLLKHPIPAAAVMSTRFLPHRCTTAG